MAGKLNSMYLGLGKTLFNSSASLIRLQDGSLDIELLLSERLTRQKACGNWPELPLKNLISRWNLDNVQMAENRDVALPAEIEEYYNKKFPFYEHLEAKGLSQFSQKFNQKLRWLPHHLCHVYAAHLMSPYEKSIIVVMDGAGSNFKDFADQNHGPKNFSPNNRYLEECSIYLQDGNEVSCVDKRWQTFVQNPSAPQHWLSEGLGSLYEKSAEYIFNDKRAAGKVMGLAAFGRPFQFSDRIDFLGQLDWNQAFTSKGKAAWETSEKYSLYCDVAASVQAHFEKSVLQLVQDLHKKYPDYKNLILTGGCALNCTTNMMIYNLGIFDSVYVPPFPGDESIGLGAASYLYHQTIEQRQPRPWEIQNGYFGSPDSIPTSERVRKVFEGFEIIQPESIEAFAAEKISQGQVIGWHQGRSETGPRALGNRSILARVDRPGMKDYLNAKVKMRESFRPYGCSVLHEKSHYYFDVPAGFENPFMSFAVKTRSQAASILKEVTHYDGTSRMQTVRATQNTKFHKLISEVEKRTDIACVLNTSLNVMGQPIVESIEDAKNFLLKTEVSGLAIGDFFIPKPGY